MGGGSSSSPALIAGRFLAGHPRCRRLGLDPVIVTPGLRLCKMGAALYPRVPGLLLRDYQHGKSRITRFNRRVFILSTVRVQ